MSQFVYWVYATFFQSPYTVMLLFEGSWNLSRPFLSYLDFACRPFPVQLLVCAPYDRVLPHHTALLSTSCWMMGDALCPPSIGFHPIDFRSFTLGLESRVILSALRLAVISGRFSFHRQYLGIHQCPLIDGSSQVFDLKKFIHTS